VIDVPQPQPSPAVAAYTQDAAGFQHLELDEQLMLIADIVLFWADMKVWALERNGKTRVDSCIEAQKYYNREKYWDDIQMNLKKRADIAAADRRLSR
jgi:hypothetical protein